MINSTPEAVDTTGLRSVKKMAENRNAIVELFFDANSNEHVIVKKGLNPSQDTLSHEANIMQQLTHPNIVKFKAFTLSSSHTRRIFMEYVEISLGTLLREYDVLNDQITGNDSAREKHLQIALGIASGLHYLREQMIVHRDIKTDNILVDKDCKTVKLCDFGLSIDLKKIDKSSANWSVGTVRWASPEIANYALTKQEFRLSPDDPYKIDIWPLGQTLLQLYINTNAQPFNNNGTTNGSEITNLLFIILGGQHDKIPEGKPLTEVITWCMTKNPEERPDALQVIEAVNKLKL